MILTYPHHSRERYRTNGPLVMVLSWGGSYLLNLNHLIGKVFLLYPATQKVAGIMLYLQKILSVRLSVRPSALRFRTLTWVVFDWFSSNFAWTLISGGVVWDCRWTTELWPLIDVKMSFPDSNLSRFWPIFLQTLYGHWYKGGVVWDCKLAKFIYKQQLWPLIGVKMCFSSISSEQIDEFW